MKLDFSNPYRLLFAIWALACIVILPYMSKDASITEDELQHLQHGNTILAWYEGKDSTAAVSPFVDLDSSLLSRVKFDTAKLQVLQKGFRFSKPCVWKADDNVEGTGSKTAINIYGGLFDSFSALAYKVLLHRYFGIFEARHFLSAIFGALLILFTGLICQRLTGSWQVGLLGIILATFTPRLIGNSLSNPKDLPQATMFAFGLLQIICFLKELPGVSIKRVILLTLGFSLAMAIRSGAVILIFYFVAFAAAYIVIQMLLGDINRQTGLKLLLVTAGISLAGYLGSALFWPWDMGNPLLNPLRSLAVFTNFNSFDCFEIFEGHWLHQNELPWYFVPKWLYITLPVTIVLGVILFFVLIPYFLQRGGLNILIYGLLLVSVIFPIATIIINKSNIYNGARHVMFVIPSLIVIATLGWAALFKQVNSITQRRLLYVVLTLLIAEPALFIFNNHPVQAMYFSPLIGGELGAFRNYEMDYWGYSVKPAVDWLEQTDSLHRGSKKPRVRMYYGEQMKLSYYIDTTPNQSQKGTRLAYAICSENSTDWDYQIVLPAEAKHDPDLLLHWPPPNTVYEVKAGKAPLCAVTKNPRVFGNETPTVTVTTQPPANAPVPKPVFDKPVDSSTWYLAYGINFYNAKKYDEAVMAFKKSLQFNPGNNVATNNLAASYNQLKMFDAAIAVAQKGLAANPDFSLLRNNLTESVKAKNALVPTEGYYDDISYHYYVQNDYLKVIENARLALKLNPNSVVAYNNICSAYNLLGNYQKALEACNKGLAIDAKNGLLQNNQQEALRMAGKK